MLLTKFNSIHTGAYIDNMYFKNILLVPDKFQGDFI